MGKGLSSAQANWVVLPLGAPRNHSKSNCQESQKKHRPDNHNIYLKLLWLISFYKYMDFWQINFQKYICIVTMLGPNKFYYSKEVISLLEF